MTREELDSLIKAWNLIARKREAQAQKQAREGAHMASSYSAGVSAGMQVAAYDLAGLMKGWPT